MIISIAFIHAQIVLKIKHRALYSVFERCRAVE